MFRFNTAGESHGRALVAIVEGLPAGLSVDVELINRELERRQWGYGRGGRMKIERDRVEVLRRVRRPRPGHADLAGGLKYGARDLREILERASARETAARVACGALAKQLLSNFGVEVRSHVAQLGGVPASPLEVGWEDIRAIPDDAPLRCADATAQEAMVALIDEKKREGDTLGGVFEVVARGVVAGLGSHT